MEDLYQARKTLALPKQHVIQTYDQWRMTEFRVADRWKGLLEAVKAGNAKNSELKNYLVHYVRSRADG